MRQFSVKITTLHYPNASAQGSALLTQFKDCVVTIPLNEARRARVTVSLYDPVCAHIKALERMLWIMYGDTLVFWGPILNPEWDAAAGTVTINAVDQSIRLQKQFLRYGDMAIDPENGMNGRIPLGYVGYRLLRDAGKNTAAQTAANYPDLGIKDGTNTDTQQSNTPLVKLDRGTQVWAAMTEIATSLNAPDFELEPIDTLNSSDKNYAKLNVWWPQGRDKTVTWDGRAPIAFHYGFGADNLEAFSWTQAGDQVSNYAHVLSSDARHRATRTYGISAARFGVYVSWTVLQASVDSETNMVNFGDGIVYAYGEPPDHFTFTPRYESWRYLDDFIVGDVVTAAARVGALSKSISGRITQVELTQQDDGRVKETLEVAPNVVNLADIGSA